MKGHSINSIIYGTSEIETDGKVLTVLSPGVGHDSTAQGDKMTKIRSRGTRSYALAKSYFSCTIPRANIGSVVDRDIECISGLLNVWS